VAPNRSSGSLSHIYSGEQATEERITEERRAESRKPPGGELQSAVYVEHTETYDNRSPVSESANATTLASASAQRSSRRDSTSRRRRPLDASAPVERRRSRGCRRCRLDEPAGTGPDHLRAFILEALSTTITSNWTPSGGTRIRGTPPAVLCVPVDDADGLCPGARR